MIEVYLDDKQVLSTCCICGARFDPYANAGREWRYISCLYSREGIELMISDICVLCYGGKCGSIPARRYTRTQLTAVYVQYVRDDNDRHLPEPE